MALTGKLFLKRVLTISETGNYNQLINFQPTKENSR